MAEGGHAADAVSRGRAHQIGVGAANLAGDAQGATEDRYVAAPIARDQGHDRSAWGREDQGLGDGALLDPGAGRGVRRRARSLGEFDDPGARTRRRQGVAQPSYRRAFQEIAHGTS